MKSKYSVQEKLEWMKLLESRRTVYYISKISVWCKNDIGILWEKYKTRGIEGLRDKERRRTSPQEKIEIVRDMCENSLTLNEVALKYDVSVSAINAWRRIIRHYGETGILERKYQGRKEKKQKMPKQKPKYSTEDYERILAENKQLRADLALLKKVYALVQKKDGKEQDVSSQPSMN